MEQVEATERPVKKRGGKPQSRDHMAEISKIGGEVMKKKGAIKAYEKAQKRKELDEKFAMIQAELAKQNGTAPIEPEPIQIPEEKPVQEPVIQKRKPKKIIEVIEEEDDDQNDEEEVIVKRIIKKKPPAPKKEIPVDPDDIIYKTNLEMLKNKFNEDAKRRLMKSLFGS